MTRFRLLPVLVLGLLLASCTSTNAQKGTTAVETSTTFDALSQERQLSPSSQPAHDDGAEEVPEGDLETLSNTIFGSATESSDLSLHVRHEEIIESCMRDQGFEYIPLPYPGETASPRFDDSLTREEFARTYGYGSATLIEADELASAVVAATYVDPNEHVRARMSEGELAAYNEAMYGPPAPDSSSENDSYRPADHTAGCSGKAAVIYGGVQSLDISDEAKADLLDIERVVRADESVRDAERQWAACMRSAGYEVESPDDIQALLDSWLQPVWASATTNDVSTADPDGNPITVEVPAFDRDALESVQDREIELAVTDLDCDETASLTQTEDAVRKDARVTAIRRWYGDLSDVAP